MRIFKPQKSSATKHKATPKQVELEITRMSHDGRGIGQNGGKTTFVQGALPGERVQVTITRQEKRFDEGTVLAVLTPSAERIEPPCPHYGRCGGCSLQHLGHTAQRQYKQHVLAEQLLHFGQLAPGAWLPTISGDEWRYRHRAKFAIARQGEQVQLGFRVRASHALEAVSDCLIAHPDICALLTPLANTLQALPDPLPTDVEISRSDAQQPRLGACFYWERTPPSQHLEALASLCQAQHVVHAIAQTKQRTTLIHKDAEAALRYQLPEHLQLAFAPGDFTQVNQAVNRQLIESALTLLAPSKQDRVLDLFSGLGNFSLPLAQHSAEVIGLEFGQAMVERATENARANQLHNLRFEACDLLRDDLALPACDLALLDPPREGAQQACLALGRLKPKRIVYVSCNPATLARDARLLVDAGYQLASAGAVDMFPHTSHLEAIALFVRR